MSAQAKSIEQTVDMTVHRNDFPIFFKLMNGQRLTYLDTASSAQKPQTVIEAMRFVQENHYSNIHRGLYNFSQVNTEVYESVRAKAAKLINARSDQEIIFTRNSTAGFNIVSQCYGRIFLQKGDEIILSEMEHHANIVPWQILRDQIGVELKIIPVLDDGTLDLEAFSSLLSNKTRLIAVSHASNVLGTINPVQAMVSEAKGYNQDIIVVVDGSQAVVHGTADVQELGCDFYVFTGHKLYGPNGVGVLWGRSDLLETMPPYEGGGDMIETVSFEGTEFKKPPYRFEAGTPAIVEVIGLGAAIDYVLGIGAEAIAAHEKNLLDQLMQELAQIDGLNYFGTAQHKAGIVSFTADWAHASDLAMILDQCGVAIRTGHHCCMPLMARLGVDATARVSFGLYSNEEDIESFIKALKKAKDMLS